MSLGTSYSPPVPVEGLQVTSLDQCLHIVMVIGKCADAFRGIFLAGGGVEGRGLCGGELPMEEFVIGKENFYEGGAGFLIIILKNNEKINMKKFFQLKVRNSIKT